MWTKKEAIAVVLKQTLGVFQVRESSTKMSVCSQNEATAAIRSAWEPPSWDSVHCLLPSLYFLKYFLLHISQGRNFKTSSTWKAEKLYCAMTLIIFLLHYCDQPMWACVCTCMLYKHMCAVCAHICESLCIACTYMCAHICELCPHVWVVCAHSWCMGVHVCVICVSALPPILLGSFIELPEKSF